MYNLGIDIGYSSVKVALLDDQSRLVHSDYALHKGAISETFHNLLEDLAERFDPRSVTLGGVTGAGISFLAEKNLGTKVNEVAALVEGARLLDKDARSIVEIGGQSAKYVTGFHPDEPDDIQVSMNPNCSSGTGSFLESQMNRLNLDIEDYGKIAARATFVPRIAGRCSVFAKTDITHHQQEGVGIENILKGLAMAMAKNYRSAVMRGLIRTGPIILSGGISRNPAMHEALTNVLGKTELRHPDNAHVITAIGAAAIGQNRGYRIDLRAMLDLGDSFSVRVSTEETGMVLPPLAGFGTKKQKNDHACSVPSAFPVQCTLGIDVGSTSTDLVLADDRDRIIAWKYLRTAGDPVRAVRTGLEELAEEWEDSIRITGAATTGSGRYMIARLVGADVVRDEITAQARAAVAIDPEVDTIFEIGGQDSKFIALENGAVTDFQMNKVCAAGTGSFIEEQAEKLGIPIDDYENHALASKGPIGLGERCTVFMETSIASHLAAGASREDLAAGLCYSIVKNYLNRVVGQKKVGSKIFFQGGVAHNQGVVNAFRAITGKKITVPPFFSITGAYGAAILAREEMEDRPTLFRGFDPAPLETTADHRAGAPDRNRPSRFNEDLNRFIFKGYDSHMDPAKKTVGIPRALFTYGMFPMFYPFFRELGVNVLLSEPTGEETVRKAQEYSLDETCYPVKLLNGHAAELVEKGVDFLFLPDLHTVFHPGSKARKDYGCPYMQLAFKIISRAMDLKTRGIGLLAPTIAFAMGPNYIKQQFMDVGTQLDRSPEQTMHALQRAMESYKAFENGIGQRSKEFMAGLDPDKKTFVLISKIYGVGDPYMNLGIADRLAEMGYDTVPFFDLPETDIFTDHPNMYWPFDQHILEAARKVRETPNLHAIFLTHHGCGPDTVTAHYFREIMGDKHFLNIEVDEHSSDVGVITRVEAFVRSLKRTRAAKGKTGAHTGPDAPLTPAITTNFELSRDTRLLLPNLTPYAEIGAQVLQAKGISARVMELTSAASLDNGKKHILANEYFSMAGLLGDVLTTLDDQTDRKNAILFPQNEGGEVDGQYARFLRTKLDEQGKKDVTIVAPFMEDLLYRDRDVVEPLFFTLVAGDLITCAPVRERHQLLETVQTMIATERYSLADTADLARTVARIPTPTHKAHILAIGEPLILYNDILNNHILTRLEADTLRITRAPLAEYLLTFWRDYTAHSVADQEESGETFRKNIEIFAQGIRNVSSILGSKSPYESDPDRLSACADNGVGFYAGAFGRYRQAKITATETGVDGVITLASMYENTEISLNILHTEFTTDHTPPVLHLTFDGNSNDNDRTKLESFIYYLTEATRRTA